MAKYQQLVDQLREQIEANIWQPGEKLPSLRQQADQSGLSLMTVMHAYEVLESQGWILSKPQSGYYIAPRAAALRPRLATQTVERLEQTDTNSFVFDVLQATRDPAIMPFGSAFPDPELFPQRQLMRSLVKVSHNLKPTDALNNLPPGNPELRKILAQRYAQQGITISPDDIVITNGAMEALNLSLQAVTEPGDWVVIENPSFYGALQAIERLKLNAIAIASDVEQGIDFDELEQALQRWPVKACWLMTNRQNPLGFTLSNTRKEQLVALLARYGVTLIEDDVYSELWIGEEKPLPAKAFDRLGDVMHCGSFSKNLVAGFRIGWVAAGRHAQRVQRIQLMSTLSTSAPMQLALADFLSTRSYDSHLKRLRQTLAKRKQLARTALRQVLPADARISDTPGGYFLWVALPEGINTTQLYHLALEQGISIAPGQLFSSSEDFRHCFRFNTAWPWDARAEAAVEKLGQLIKQLHP
ncbi:PLP-dependent aminotransferase family protein [Pantoea phytobeneficialis]|uniref:GntR family transcriptional regulator n=1 Tax=Pantoea phytobeneficialis TaxID=2052056 RepID=A0AAP9H5R8_9GAMM|nr:PLP-dependent aminotransferase family protein [Pantoea phytobeneficialis]MDO6409188.1 PLP-dependent aminotransferase family protein [Pantoea phytobeneficialis]QGR07069.1 GntR family transcriptional regulator [Pantoea phytobeneficialis]